MANPNANAIPSTSMAVGPLPIPAMTAAPHPKKTSVNVPINSAVGFFILLSLRVKIDCFTTLQELGFLRIRESSINTPLMRIRSNLRFGSFATGASDSQASYVRHAAERGSQFRH